MYIVHVHTVSETAKHFSYKFLMSLKLALYKGFNMECCSFLKVPVVTWPKAIKRILI